MLKTLTRQQIRHLHYRAGFGLAPGQLRDLEGKSAAQLVRGLFSDSEKFAEIKTHTFSPRKESRINNLPPDQRRKARMERREQLQQLGHTWLRKMATDRAQLREKMTLFWHGHFACHVKHPFGMQDLNNVMRRHALGNFGALLTAVSRHPTMLEYLNARQNRKQHPNENFARELLELFTLGRGHYTEDDIKEAARAFTGWNFNQEAQFVFRQRHHDFGEKTFRGKTGNFGGEDIIRMVLEDKQTARFICTKLYHYFVNPKVDAAHVEMLATVFHESDYDIGAVMEAMLTADWFYAASNIGVKIKSPIELLAGLMRGFDMDFQAWKKVNQLQQVLGQVLFHPPNVAGWPGGRSWIDSSTLTLRMNIGQLMLFGAGIEAPLWEQYLKPSEKREIRRAADYEVRMTWKRINQELAQVPEEELAEAIAERLLQADPLKLKLDLLDENADPSNRTSKIHTLHLRVTALPEYQLC